MDFIINQDFHGVRLDRFLCKKFSGIPLSGIYRMIRKGRARVNGKRKKPHFRLQKDDTVRVWVSSGHTVVKDLIQLSSAEKTLAAESIVHEDEHCLICNKPSGLVMHTGSGHDHGLTEIMQAYTHNSQLHFVHRIDKNTSGLVLAAKTLIAARELSAQIRGQKIEKYYFIVVQGIIKNDHFTISSYLKKEADSVVTHPDANNGAKIAQSDFTVLTIGKNRTLLEARLHTGRTHQLRVQLADEGYPIVGDYKYGRKEGKKMFLFSHRLVILSHSIDVSLPVPEIFYSPLTAE